MEKSSESGSRLSRLTAYAGPFRWLTYAALAMSAVSAALSVVPYYYIWCILDEVLAVYPNLDSASGIVHNGWMALAFTVLSIAFYIAALMCSHKAAFRISKNIKKKALDHVLGLPPGAFDMIGSGKPSSTAPRPRTPMRRTSFRTWLGRWFSPSPSSSCFSSSTGGSASPASSPSPHPWR